MFFIEKPFNMMIPSLYFTEAGSWEKEGIWKLQRNITGLTVRTYLS